MVTFEIPVIPLTVTASASIHEDYSTANAPAVGASGIPGPTNRIIQRDQDFSINFQWTTNGLGSQLLNGGHWKCEALLEKKGSGEVTNNPFTTEPDLGINGQSYLTNIPFAAGTLSEGVYDVVVRMQYYYNGVTPSPFAGFEHLGMINIIEEL